MKDNIPDFIKDATNVYRTKGYIVKQVIGIQYDCKENTSYSATILSISGRQSATRNMRYSSVTGVTSTASACPLPCTREHISTDRKSPETSGLSLWEKLWFCYGKLVNL